MEKVGFQGGLIYRSFLATVAEAGFVHRKALILPGKKKKRTLFNYERGLMGITLRKRNKHHLEVQEGTKRYMPLLIFMGLPSLRVWQIR